MDGFAAGANHNAGAGVYSRYFSLSRAVGANCTNYDGEVAAVHMALTKVVTREDRNIGIFILTGCYFGSLISSAFKKWACSRLPTHDKFFNK
ncbi:hypothetical protein TNCT_517421 [Trichonephila clavata]|uniref:Uncharacterized protein n=1 Tax=Trichonephila clavata TaxID=2740835 RepID=A0A8X6M0P8_TRICU|nr:hypothetical protein TNCT_517421 [Trichonephila clavata]